MIFNQGQAPNTELTVLLLIYWAGAKSGSSSLIREAGKHVGLDLEDISP